MSVNFRLNVLRVISVALISMGWMQVSVAGVIGTQYAVEAETRMATLNDLEALLLQDRVADQLQKYGVDASHVSERLNGLTTAELLELESRIDTNVAGGDALAVIGTVFLVLLILELVGVTDVFKSL